MGAFIISFGKVDAKRCIFVNNLQCYSVKYNVCVIFIDLVANKTLFYYLICE